ncbi:MAG: hypothetical protein WD872_09065 [Pirellulaceae bacterium]
MPAELPAIGRQPLMQFSLASLLKYVTICSVLAAASSAAGVASALLLAGMALALAARNGWLAILSFGVALLLADWPFRSDEKGAVIQTVAIIALALALSFWYRLEHLRADRIAVQPLAEPASQ